MREKIVERKIKLYKKAKKSIAFVLSLVMVLTMLPANVFTDQGGVLEVQAAEPETPAVDVPDGYYNIQCAGSTSYYLNVTGGNYTAGTNIQIWQDKHVFYIYKDTSRGKYRILPQNNTNLALDYSVTNGNNLILSTKKSNSDGNQLWTFENSTSNSGAYVIKTAWSDGKVIDIAGATYSNGTNVQLYASNNSHAQSFNLIPLNKAEITASNGAKSYYTSVEAAFKAATTGCTIKVLSDDSLPNNDGCAITTSCTVDLNGHVINGVGDTIRVIGSGITVKVKNGTINCPTGTSDIRIRNGAKAYFEDVKFTGNNAFFGTESSSEAHFGKGVVCETSYLFSSSAEAVLYITDGLYNYTKLETSTKAIPTNQLFITGGCFSNTVTTYQTYVQEGYDYIDCAHGRTGYKDIKASSTKPSVKEDTDSTYKPTHIANGGFETRPFMPFKVGSTTYNSFVNESTPASGTRISSSTPNGVNGGWNTTETQVYNGGLFEWSNSPGTYGLSSAGDGSYFIEMNAYNPSVLYQDLATNGGDVIIWTLKHAARDGSTAQAIVAEVGAPNGTPSAQSANIKGATLAKYTYNSVSGTYGKANSSDLTALRTTNKNWPTAKGIYIVPKEQSTTRFAFISTEPAGSWGNMLDAITFDTLIGNLQAAKQEDGSVKVAGYWGDSDSSKKLIIRIGGTLHTVNMLAYRNKNFVLTIPASVIGDAPSFEVYHQDYELGKKTLVLKTYETTIEAKVKLELESDIPTGDVMVDCTIAAVTAGAPLPSNPTVSIALPKTADGTSTTSWTVAGLEANNTYTYKITQSTTASGVTLDTGVMYATIHLDENGNITSSYQEEIADLTSEDSFVMNKQEGEASYDPSITTIRLGSDTQKTVAEGAFNTALIKSTFSIDFTKNFTISGSMQAADVPDGSLVGFVPSSKRATDITLTSGGQMCVYGKADNKNGIFLEFDTYGNGTTAGLADNTFGAAAAGKHFALVKTDGSGNAQLTNNVSNVANSVAYTSTTFPKQELTYTIKNTVNDGGAVLTFSLSNGVVFNVANPRSIFGQDTAYFLLAGALRFGPANNHGLGAVGASAPETKITLSRFNYLESSGETEDYFSNQYTCPHSWVYMISGNNICAYCSKCKSYGNASDLSKAPSLSPTANDAVYTASPYTGASMDTAQKTAWTKAGLTLPTIMYVGRDETNYTESSTAPTNVGKYTAKITVDGKTRTKDFEITKKEITVTGITASNKVYDGSDTASLVTTGATFTGKYDGDNLTVSATGTFDNANAGENKTVSISNLALGGTSAPNYKLAASGQQTSTSATITKADGSVTPPTAKVLTYTGEAQELINAGSSTTGTIMYEDRVDGTYSESIPTATNAGEYTVCYKVVGDINHKDVAESSVNVIIGKKKIAKPSADTNTYTYNGSEQTYSIPANDAYNVYGNKATNAGTHKVEVELKDNTNTCWDDNTIADLEYNFVIDKANDQTVSANNITATYGDTDAKVLASASKHGVITYAVTDGADVIDVNGTTGALTIKKVGTATVTVTAAETADHKSATKDVTVTINPATMEVSSTNGSATYQAGTATDGGAVVTVTTPASGYTIKYGESFESCSSNSIPKFENAGIHAVYYKVTADNYKEYTGSFTIAINTADFNVTVPTAKTPLTYTGSELVLINPGSAFESTIQYSLDGGNTYSTDIPKATNAGTYTVTYKIEETNYTTYIDSLTIIIHQADASVTAPTARELTYTGEAQALIEAGSAGGVGTIKYKVDDGEYIEAIPTARDAGNYTVFYKVERNANYKEVRESSVTVTIGKQKIAKPSQDTTTFTYDGTEKTYTVSENAAYTIIGNKVTNAGTHEVEVELKDTENTCWDDNTIDDLIFDFVIGKSNDQTIAAHDVIATYGDTGVKVIASASQHGIITYAVKEGSDIISIDETTGALTIMKSGTAVVTITAAETADYASVTKDVTITINPNTMTVSSTNGTATYDGTATKGEADVTVTNPASGYTIKYGTSLGTYDSDSIPTFTDAGTYTIYYKITADHYEDYTGSLTVTIEKAAVEAPSLIGVNETICGKQDGKITGLTTAMEYRLSDDSDYTAVTDASMTFEAGSYKVRYKTDANHYGLDATIVIEEGRKLTITLPTEQIGYILTSIAATGDWHTSPTLTFALKDGYCKTTDFKVIVNGSEVTLTDDTYTLPAMEDDVTVSVEGVAVAISPTAKAVHFDLRGGAFTSTYTLADVWVEAGDKLTKPVFPEGVKLKKGDLSFQGWFRDEACTEEWDFANDRVTEDMILYAGYAYDAGNMPEEAEMNVSAIEDVIYTGKAITPSIVVKHDGELLTLGKDYTVTYKNNVNANPRNEDGSLITGGIDANYNAKLPTIIVKGKGNYKDVINLNFNIKPRSITPDNVMTADITDAIVIKPKSVSTIKCLLKYNNKKLKTGKDYTAELKKLDDNGNVVAVSNYPNLKVPKGESGKYRLTVTGIGNFNESYTRDIILTGEATVLSLSKASVKFEKVSYEGSAISAKDLKAKIKSVKIGKITVNADDYEVVLADDLANGGTAAAITSAGKYAVTIKAKNAASQAETQPAESNSAYSKLEGSKLVMITVTGMPISKAKASFGETPVYNGKSFGTNGMKLTVKPAGSTEEKILVEGVDYTVKKVTNANRAGKATVEVTGKGGYTGSKKFTYKINKKNIADNDLTVKAVATQKYQKSGAMPDVEISLANNTATLKKGVDYTLSYKNNNKVGSASLTVKGKGNFTGTRAEIPFTIEAGSFVDSNVKVDAADVVYNAKKASKYQTKVTLYDGNGKKLSAGKDYSKEIKYYEYSGEFDGDYSSNAIKAHKGALISEGATPAAGTRIVVEVASADSGTYTGEVYGSYRIVPVSISKAKIKINDQEYTGQAIEISVNSISKAVINKTTNLTYGRDYEIIEGSYTKNVKVGTASVKIRGLGNYGGTKVIKFKIVKKKMQWWKKQ